MSPILKKEEATFTCCLVVDFSEIDNATIPDQHAKMNSKSGMAVFVNSSSENTVKIMAMCRDLLYIKRKIYYIWFPHVVCLIPTFIIMYSLSLSVCLSFPLSHSFSFIFFSSCVSVRSRIIFLFFLKDCCSQRPQQLVWYTHLHTSWTWIIKLETLTTEYNYRIYEIRQ